MSSTPPEPRKPSDEPNVEELVHLDQEAWAHVSQGSWWNVFKLLNGCAKRLLAKIGVNLSQAPDVGLKWANNTADIPGGIAKRLGQQKEQADEAEGKAQEAVLANPNPPAPDRTDAQEKLQLILDYVDQLNQDKGTDFLVGLSEDGKMMQLVFPAPGQTEPAVQAALEFAENLIPPDQPLESLLDDTIVKILHGHGITSLADLAALDDDALLALKDIGPKRLATIKAAISDATD